MKNDRQPNTAGDRKMIDEYFTLRHPRRKIVVVIKSALSDRQHFLMTLDAIFKEAFVSFRNLCRVMRMNTECREDCWMSVG